MSESSHGSWIDLHREAMRSARPAGPDFLEPLRAAAHARFRERGFPTLRQERWRFTDVSAVAETAWRRAAEGEGETALPLEDLHADPAAYRLVFVNGRFSASRSRLPGAETSFSVQRLSALNDGVLEPAARRMAETAGRTEEPFALINSALAEEGVVITIPDHMAVLVPLEILHYVDGDGIALHPRVVMIVGEQSEALLIESYAGKNGQRYFTNPAADVVVGRGSKLDHYLLQRESASAYHLSYTRATLGREARYRRFALDMGGRLVRHDLEVELDGEGAEASLSGLYMPAGRQHIDHHTTLRHLQPHTFSRQLYKGVLQDKAHSVFNGRIYVAREAQRTDAIQHNRNLLLSDDALADSQPQLEIFADDVRCTHGGTVGQLDQEGLFYLRSRGIGADLARQIMVHAFAGEITGGIGLAPVRELAEAVVNERLGREE
ncbi:MAG: FeS cluster assembly protein SufD [bacterium ADurb.Bin431]|nr:MAG: FeS cluster assembly protein SufD [bacterium ADurb.Bin431]HPG81821.1 Fe-S cluster assembly protein SufD [bacterium]HPM59351.1 Fe-S cluster assembly protein SufD [bacterium]